MSQMNDCSCMAPAVEIPVHGLKISLDEAALKSIQSPPVIGAGVPVGTMLLLPFRKDELPVGWYFCDGAAVALDSAAGTALNALPLGYKADWGIAVENDTITLPNLFSEDGRGCFPRPVNGVARQVGAVEGDAIRNIEGDFSATAYNADGTDPGHGPFYLKRTGMHATFASAINTYGFGFDASRVVPTAGENRPLNIGMTPAVYLGV